MDEYLPRVAIVDDLFGRQVTGGVNEDRENLCASFLLKDVTGDPQGSSHQKVKQPIAEAVFFRGQLPVLASIGDVVENDLEGTLNFLRSGWQGSGPHFKRWSLVLLDLCFYTGRVTGKLSAAVAGEGGKRAEVGMPEGRAEDIVPSQFFGLKLLRAIHTELPDLPVVILSSQEREKVSRDYSAHGALAFLPRSEMDDGEKLLKTYLDRHGLMEDSHGLIIGRSLPLLKALRAARRTAYNEQRENILVRGERGVGKEVFARFLHQVHPRRSSKPLISVNSAVLTSELYASEIFGIEKRVASEVDQRRGAALLAHGGDLFFDEVKDMVPQAQAGILRLLEEGSFTPVGSHQTIEADVRVLSATNADLEALVASGHFREDLFDRLRRGGSLILPPLRERREDIPLLALSFVRQAEALMKPTGLQRQFTQEALDYLVHDDWPGNVRALRDVVQRVVKDSDVEYIYPAHIEKAQQALGMAAPGASRVVLSKAEETSPAWPVADNKLAEPSHQPSAEPSSLSDMLRMLSEFHFEVCRPDELRGKLDELDQAAARLVVHYLLASLQITKDQVTNEPVITKAIQFVTGNRSLTTSSAADTIKRLLKRHPATFQAALENPLLKKAYQQAESLRPTNRTKKRDT